MASRKSSAIQYSDIDRRVLTNRRNNTDRRNLFRFENYGSERRFKDLEEELD